jgi:hypothetical protein
MKCKAVARWLDQGMPEKARDVAMRHVAVCGSCFEAFEAASSVEAALRAEAAVRAVPVVAAVDGAPACVDFVANVMARVEGAESIPRKAKPVRRPSRAWIELAADPLTVISITIAALVTLWSAWHPNWFYEAGMNLAARWWSVATLQPRSPIELDPYVWAGLAIAAFPFVVLGIWVLYRRLERAVLMLAARPTH